VSRPENDAGAFRVFLALVKGLKTPSEIAESLSIRKSTVVFHLNRLKHVGLVFREEKIGKMQPYGINWNNVHKLFLETVAPITTFPKFDKTGFQSLVENANFQNLVKSGLVELANHPYSQKLKIGLKDYFKMFREAVKMASLNESIDSEIRSFLEAVKKSVWMESPGSYQWARALEKYGFASYPLKLAKP